MEAIITANGAELVASIPVPSGTTKFDQFILAAQDAGADGIEIDVHASSDGIVYVHHDVTIAAPDGSLTSAGAEQAIINGDVALARCEALRRLAVEAWPR